jgi:hypothetical protein
VQYAFNVASRVIWIFELPAIRDRSLVTSSVISSEVGTFQMILRLLGEQGVSNPTALDAGALVDTEVFNQRHGPCSYFGDFYEDRIKTVHPSSRFGAYRKEQLISVHGGPLDLEDSDIHGDGRNIAARLEAMPNLAASRLTQIPPGSSAHLPEGVFRHVSRRKLHCALYRH